MQTTSSAGYDLTKLGFRQHKKFWIATDQGERVDEIGNLPKALARQLSGWEAFSFDPEDVGGTSKPDWIDSAMRVRGDLLLIWHPNQAITEAGGPYIGCLPPRLVRKSGV